MSFFHLAQIPAGLLVMALLSILLIIAISVYRIYLHPLSGVPGPFAAKITGLWRTWRYFRMGWHDDVLSLHDTYGPVVRIAPGEVSVVDADAVKRLYSHGSNKKKTAWYDTWSDGVSVPVFFSETDKRIHAALRRRVSSAYTTTTVLKYEPYIQDCFDLSIKKFRKYADGQTAIDMAK
ncbi:cytochrome P450 [Dactylonectria macrodidyma]|uniref:Cytochrome P450 n=1 Tax=Dactylonectria macrodidyma TaxID=307937 RepID=A0A9P9E563_9HYPO|nr:cytochrome P450 [Dactylonectria macrodidyma]